MQISGTTDNSALQLLQSLFNSIENGPANPATGAGQNVPSGQTASQAAGPLPLPPTAPSLSSQFSSSSLAFLTSLQSSAPVAAPTGVAGPVSLSGLDQGLNDLSSALKEIQSALTGGATQATSTASLGAAALTSTATAGSVSLTSSTLASVLSELNTVLTSLEQDQGPSRHHHHHHHTETASSGASSTSATSTSAASTTNSSDTSTTTT